MKVKVLRAFQNHEVGSIIDLEGPQVIQFLSRKMVEEYKEPAQEKNRAVGLENSAPKKSAKRKK
jgi:hypothetical protein